MAAILACAGAAVVAGPVAMAAEEECDSINIKWTGPADSGGMAGEGHVTWCFNGSYVTQLHRVYCGRQHPYLFSCAAYPSNAVPGDAYAFSAYFDWLFHDWNTTGPVYRAQRAYRFTGTGDWWLESGTPDGSIERY